MENEIATEVVPPDDQNIVANDSWSSRDSGWMMNLFGTAVGAGILYLPVNAGAGGIWPLIVLSILAGPMVWLAHRNLVRFCLGTSNPASDITGAVTEYFGPRAGKVLTLAYFFSIFPIILLYGIGITNVVISFIESQLQWALPPRLMVSFVLVCALIAVMHVGEKWMLLAVKGMCYPLVLILLGITVYLIPQWNPAAFDQPFNLHDMISTLFLTIPLLIFSFNHSPACSAFARAYRLSIGDKQQCADKTGLILKRNTMLLLVVILSFVFSCVLSLSPEDLQQARAMNVPVLSVLANRTESQAFAYIAPAIAFLAIASSFFGVYLGCLEGLQGLVTQHWLQGNRHKSFNPKALARISVLFLLVTCVLAGYANWSVIAMVDMLVVPVLATILYLMPVYAFYRVKNLRHFRSPLLDVFTVIVGIVAITAFLLDKLL